MMNNPDDTSGERGGGSLERMISQPVRIQLSRKRGWKMPPNTVKVDRTTKWGNPFRVGQKNPYGTTTKDVRHSYMLYVGFAPQNEKLVAAARAELAGKNLACWCRLGESCHADVLLKLANDSSVSDGGHETERLKPGRDAAARCSAWLGGWLEL